MNCSVIFPLYASAGFVFRNDKDVTVVINDSEEQVVHTALEMFQRTITIALPLKSIG